MKEYILIENFGPIKKAEIVNIKKITIFIGESGSGKSTILKVVALFRWIYKMMSIRSFLKYSGIKKSPFGFNFDTYIKNNGQSSYLNSNTRIIYRYKSVEIIYENGKLQKTSILVPQDELSLEKISFISDKRQLIPDAIESNVTIKKQAFYLNETLEDYKLAIDSIKEKNVDFLNVKYIKKQTSQGVKYIIKPIPSDSQGIEDYDVRLNQASSGTQTTIPLVLIIEYYAKYYDLVQSLNMSIFSYVVKTDTIKDFKPISNIGEFTNKRVHLFVEEPELSLFPDSQCRLMDYIVNILCVDKPENYDITMMMATHSPYIINYLNVLLHRDGEKSKENLEEKDLSVYRVKNGELFDIVVRNEVTNNKAEVDTSDLSDIMGQIYDEYISLLNE